MDSHDYKYYLRIRKHRDSRIALEKELLLSQDNSIEKIVDMVLQGELCYDTLLHCEIDFEEDENFIWDSVIKKNKEKYKKLIQNKKI